MNKIICNRFGGVRQVNPAFSNEVITASDMQNVELYFTGINNGVGIRTQKGNVNITADLIPEGETVVNVFESIQNKKSYMFIHTVSSSEGKVYLYNNSELTQKLSGLAVTSVSEGADYAQGYRDLFIFANGVDDYRYIEIGQTPDNGVIKAVDLESRPIKGLGLANYAGRLWTFVDNRLHYCVTSNVFDWSTSDSEIPTSAGFIEFAKNITAICPYINSLAVFFKDSSTVISGSYPFSTTEDSPGGCAGYNSRIFHGTDLFFYDDTKKGIFSFQQVILGNKTLGDNVALNIQQEFNKIDRSRINEIKTVSVNLDDRNEIWFLIPTTDAQSLTLIFDYRTKEWVKRLSQKLSSLRMIDNILYSSSGNKVLREYQGYDFDGEFIHSFYKMSPFNAGSYNTLKGFWYPPRISLRASENNFWVKYIKNLDVFKKVKERKIIAKFKNYLEWNVSNWNEKYWYSSSAIKMLCKLPKPALFKTLEIEFHTYGKHESFNIQNIEFSEIQTVQA